MGTCGANRTASTPERSGCVVLIRSGQRGSAAVDSAAAAAPPPRSPARRTRTGAKDARRANRRSAAPCGLRRRRRRGPRRGFQTRRGRTAARRGPRSARACGRASRASGALGVRARRRRIAAITTRRDGGHSERSTSAVIMVDPPCGACHPTTTTAVVDPPDGACRATTRHVPRHDGRPQSSIPRAVRAAPRGDTTRCNLAATPPLRARALRQIVASPITATAS